MILMFLQRKRQEGIDIQKKQLQILNNDRRATHKLVYKVNYINLNSLGKRN